jgi:hypothetical protein
MTTRQLILEAIKSGDRLTTEDIRDYVRRWAPTPLSKQSIGQTLRHMTEAHDLAREGDYFILPDRANTQIVQANPEGERVTLAPFQQKRSGRLVTIEHSPLEVEDVARIQLKVDGHWFPVPLFGDVRICIGPDTPRWNPEQETYEGASCLKIITKDGKTSEMNLDIHQPVTIAPRQMGISH